MDITRTNFQDVLPEIFRAIDECDFMAIDTEFTGLSDGPMTRITSYDTPETYYSKLKDSAREFLVVQVGLCTFRYNFEEKKYSYKAFNFYVFPRTVGRNGNDVKFLCQSSSIHFLSNNGFDFNKLFKEGISYLNSSTEEVLLKNLATRHEYLKEPFSKISVPEEQKAIVEDICFQIKDFLSSDKGRTELVFEGLNAFVRKLIFQTAYERFPSKCFYLSTKWVDNKALLMVYKGKSKADIEEDNLLKEKNEISEAVGFSKVIEYISNSRKLIVGHNMFWDICHIVNRFCRPLPDSYSDFKKQVRGLFPRIIDTKYMCSVKPFKDLVPSSVMDQLLKRLHESPFEFKEAEPEDLSFGYSLEQKKYHEAGFDAYTTGLVFIALTSFYKSGKIFHCREGRLLEAFENKICLLRIVDYSYIDLYREEPKPDRRHVFHITFPKEWKTSNISHVFKTFGDVSISWCSQTTAWISLRRPEGAEKVKAELIHAKRKKWFCKGNPYTLLTWDEFSNNVAVPMLIPSVNRLSVFICVLIAICLYSIILNYNQYL